MEFPSEQTQPAKRAQGEPAKTDRHSKTREIGAAKRGFERHHRTELLLRHEQADGGAFVAVYLDVGKRGHTHEVCSRRDEKPARNGDGFDGLIERGGADGLNFDLAFFADNARDGSSDGIGL